MPGSTSLGLLPAVAQHHTHRMHPLQVVAAASAHPPPPARPIDVAPCVVDDGGCFFSVPRATLTLWNAAMALFHAGLAALTLVLGNRALAGPTYKAVLDFVPRNASDPDPAAAGWDLVPRLAPSVDLPLTWLVAAFFLLSAAAHAGNATLWRRFYLAELQACRTPTRWVEYFFSAGVMILLIGYSIGLRERGVLLTVTLLVSATMPFGAWAEERGRPASADAWCAPLAHRLWPWVLGHVPQTAAWAVIVLQFYDGVADPARIPWFVHAILWGELVLFYSFGGAALLSQLGPPRLFYRGELLFQALSLGAKGLLGGLLLANVLMLSRFEEVYA